VRFGLGADRKWASFPISRRPSSRIWDSIPASQRESKREFRTRSIGAPERRRGITMSNQFASIRSTTLNGEVFISRDSLITYLSISAGSNVDGPFKDAINTLIAILGRVR
jgi:hypothetical protein